MSSRAPVSILLPFVLAACAGTGGPTNAPAPSGGAGVEAAVATISVEDVQRRVAFLSSDALLGRSTPSAGLEVAVRYASDEFRRLGLEPAGDGDSFVQRFPLDASSLDRSAVLVETRTGGVATRLAFGRDYFVIPARVDSVIGTPVFLGPARAGVMPPTEAVGRPVIFFVADTGSTAWQMTAGAALQSAIAGRVGGVVLVLAPEFPDEMIATLSGQLASQILPIAMPVVGMSYASASAMFGRAGMNLDDVRTSVTPRALEGIQLVISTPVGDETALAPNVVAILRGRDPALSNEYVVYSAHIDHVGTGTPDATGDSIYNGADDNASGTSAVLEIAEAFAALEHKPPRSIMFVLVSAEELGLLGSQHFVENPPVDVAQMIANINMDMIGRNSPDSVIAIGQDYTTLGPTVQRVAAANRGLRLVVAPDLWPEEQLFFRSDHFSFAMKEIPAIFFTTGLHDDYHKPSDEVERIDRDKLARISRLLFRLGYEIATAPERPQWTPAGRAAMRSIPQ